MRREEQMNKELIVGTQSDERPLSTMAQLPLVDVVEASAAKGEWLVPAVQQVRLALAVSDFSATWRGSRGILSENVSAGTTSICEFDRSQRFEMRTGGKFAIVVLQSELLKQVQSQRLRPQMQAHDIIQDPTLRRLMEVLLLEKQNGFQSGVFFLDGLATTLASYLLHHYSSAPSVDWNFRGGMQSSALRRCIEYIEAHLEEEIRLHELANEAGISTSHLIRGFRQSTGKTPYQFLLDRRVQRAQTLMRNHRTPLAEVALASGFADQHHMARVFRRVTSVTPSSYRRSL